MTKEKAKSIASAEKLIYETLKILKENNGEMRYDLIKKEIAKRIEFNDWEKEIYKNGLVRWETILSFYSIDADKTGYIRKIKGIWYLTEEGEKAIDLGKEKLLESIRNGYIKWKENKQLIDNQNQKIIEGDLNDNLNNNLNNEKNDEYLINIDEIQANSRTSFTNFINNLDPYEFQDLCAALLRGMGYYTPFVAPKGKDGGVDITAYKDPLGTSTPRIKVQVKHKEDKSKVQEIRQLYGILKDDDIGVFISSSGFTPDAINETKRGNKHLELIDINKFIDLWIEFFPKMKNEDKNLMPIRAVFFINNT